MTVLRLIGASTGPHEPVDVIVDRGDLVVVTGPEDCGKTALLRAALGLLPLTTGRAELFGVDVAVAHHDVLHAARTHAALAALSAPLLANLPLRENLVVPLTMRSIPEDRAYRDVEALLAEIGLGKLMMKRPHELSPRQHREALLARALVQPVSLFLLDDPPSSSPLLARLPALQSAGAAIVVTTSEPDRLGPWASVRQLVTLNRVAG